ncbi:hypothetical protein D9M69_551030 [compost metagenome]
MLVGQHQVIAALGVQRHLLAGQCSGELGGMGATGHQHVSTADASLIGDQRHAAFIQLPTLDPLLEELHAAAFGRVHQFADHLEGIEKMPGAREEQSAPELLAELRRRIAYRLGPPEIHRHLLLAHARL